MASSDIALDPCIRDARSAEYIMAPSQLEALHGSTTLDRCYYGERSLLKPKARVLYNTRFVQQFQSLQLPAQGLTLTIPNVDLISSVVMRLCTYGSIPTDVFMPRGWGYSLIDRVEFRLGGLNCGSQQVIAY